MRSRRLTILTVLGVSQVADAVYRELIGTASATVAELAVALRLEEVAVLPAVTALERHGLVTRTITRPPRFVAAPPDTAAERMLLARQAELTEARAELDGLVQAYRSGRRTRSTDELVEIVTGAEPLAQRVSHLVNSATRALSEFVKPPFVAVDPNDGEPLTNPRVHYRNLFDFAVMDHPGLIAQLQQNLAPHEENRTHPSLPMKLIIADRETALLPLGRDSTDTTPAAVIVHSSGLLDALLALFEHYWEASTPLLIGDARGDHAGGPGDEDRTILSMLVAGATDESIARQLNISVRTVRRRVQAMTHTAQAANRAQLVWHAARHDWL